jgi:hypothetical protein
MQACREVRVRWMVPLMRLTANAVLISAALDSQTEEEWGMDLMTAPG